MRESSKGRQRAGRGEKDKFVRRKGRGCKEERAGKGTLEQRGIRVKEETLQGQGEG